MTEMLYFLTTLGVIFAVFAMVLVGFCTHHEDYPEEQHGQPE